MQMESRKTQILSKREVRGYAFSLCTSLRAIAFCRSCRFDDADGAIRGDESLLRYTANIRFGNFVYAINGVEQLTPVAITGLKQRQLRGQTFVVAQAAQ